MGVKVKTRPYGEIEVEDKQVVDFPDGILGFEEQNRFIILDTDDENSPFKWLQSFQEPELVFVIIRPADFMADYKLMVSQADLEAVEADKPEKLIVFAIVTLPSEPADMTANLQGPIIINPIKRIGRQAISLSDRYRVKHRIMDEINKNAGSKG